MCDSVGVCECACVCMSVRACVHVVYVCVRMCECV